MSYSEKGS